MNQTFRRASRVGPLLLALLLTGCLEQLSTARIPGGAVRNFLYFLSHDQATEAAAYWAPNHAPSDAAAQVTAAITTLRGWTVEATKADAQPQTDGSDLVTISGHAARAGTPLGSDVVPLVRARVIEIGPGWRITAFTLLCCSP
ncbi:MAG: hypothetical protein M3Z04_23540 [Chloroflexota bacterium]|nr:hypothetical protein [Chloroflexota bacterium]